MDKYENNVIDEQISLSAEDMQEFLDFLSEDNNYVNDGLGAFHHDNHSNW